MSGNKYRSSRALNGSSQIAFSSLSSASRSSQNEETTRNQRERIDKQLKGRKKGDMIRIERSRFLHYAILIGKDVIVDFVADNGGEVMSRDLYETVGICNCAVDNYLDKVYTPLPTEKIVERAKSAKADEFKYDLGKFNCEHFATWCRYDHKECHQPCEMAATLGRFTKDGNCLSS